MTPVAERFWARARRALAPTPLSAPKPDAAPKPPKIEPYPNIFFVEGKAFGHLRRKAKGA